MYFHRYILGCIFIESCRKVRVFSDFQRYNKERIVKVKFCIVVGRRIFVLTVVVNYEYILLTWRNIKNDY